MPLRRFDRTSWPEHGPHRELLDLLGAVHDRNGCRSERDIARRLRTPVARVRGIVRGRILPDDEAATRALLAALAGDAGVDPATADRAAALTAAARREHDGVAPWPAARRTGEPVWPDPGSATSPGPTTTRRRTTVAAVLVVLTAAVAMAVVLSGYPPL